MVCRRTGILAVVLMLPMLLMVSGARAADQHGADPLTEAPPPLELLEFLGQWETDDGEWIDPQELEDPALVNLLESVMASETAAALTDDDDANEDVNGASQDDGGSDDGN